jgi:hypothetical protein
MSAGGPLFVGVLTWYHDQGFGELTKIGDSRPTVVVYPESLAGLAAPETGQRFMYSIGDSVMRGATCATHLRPI